MKRGFLIDMDGVIYRGSDVIPGAVQFVTMLRETRTPFLFLTNNSQRTRRDMATKLCRMGIEAHENDVFTCAMATARFLARQKPGGTAYVIGEGGLLNALHTNGYAIVEDDPDYVVVGEGRTFNCEMIEKAVRLVERGAKLIATNLDPNCPTDKGLRPGCGAIVAMIEKATGKTCFSLGKPSPMMFREARKDLGLSTEETIMIGDTMETDILGGVQLGYRTILVLSGGTRREDLDKFAFQPDLIVDDIGGIDPGLTFDTPGQTASAHAHAARVPTLAPAPRPTVEAETERDLYYEQMIDLVAPGTGRLWPRDQPQSARAA